MGPGSFFGEAALLSEEPRNAYVRSLTNMEVFVLKKQDLLAALDAFPSLRDVVLQPMKDRIKTNEQRDDAYQPSWTARQPLKRQSVLDEPTLSPHLCKAAPTQLQQALLLLTCVPTATTTITRSPSLTVEVDRHCPISGGQHQVHTTTWS
jgi:hypothetical protein